MDRTRLGRVMEFLVGQRMICLALAVLLCAVGYYQMVHIPRDSFPDITPIRVEVDTEWDGIAAQEIEKLVTYPIEQALGGIPHALVIQSQSKYSISVVEVRFQPGTDLYWARSQVFQNLANATLPTGVTPQMAPMDEGSGQIYIYTLTSKKLDNMQLRTLQDFFVKPLLRVVPGVADVPMFGGYVRQFQVVLDPARLTALGLGIADINTALQNNNSSNGGNYLVRGSTQYVIRGLGLVRTLDDIRNIVVSNANNVPVRVGDVGTVRFGPEDRQGAVSVNGQGEVVAGIVIKRIGENTAAVIERVQQKLDEIQKMLTAGRNLGLDTSDVHVVTLYDQSYLIRNSTETVIWSLIDGAVLIIVVHGLFLGSLRACLLPILANVFCIFTAFTLMRMTDISANLLSLGGIALSLGMMVDATVMVLENVHRHVNEVEHPTWSHGVKVAEGTAEILRPVVLAVLVIIAVLIPVLSLQGIEGQLFVPLALAIVYAMLGSLIMAILITPALCYYLIPEAADGRAHRPNFVTRWMQWLYAPPLRFSVRHPWFVLIVCVVVMAISFVTFQHTGTEFLPPLEENNIRIRITSPPSISLKYAMDMTSRIERKVLALLPEAINVVSYVGRPELGGDPESVSNDEVAVSLKPVEQWRPGVSKDDMVDSLRKALGAIPGVNVQFSQELEMRTDEMISGFNTPITVYVLGDDPKDLMETSRRVKTLASSVDGAKDVSIEHFSGVDNLDVVPNRAQMARYGVTIGNIIDVVRGDVGGSTDGQVFLQNQHFDILARVRSDFRTDVAAIGRLLVATAIPGMRVPLSYVADVTYDVGFDRIDRYNGMRRVAVMADVEGRSVGSVVDDLKNKIADSGKLPPGITLYYGGQAEEAEHAFETMMFAVPASLLIVFLLIYICFDNLLDTIIVLSSIPLGIAGGTFLLIIMDLHLNMPAYIGFIAKFGIAVQNGMIMVAYMNTLHKSGRTGREAALEGAQTRLRPELLSALIGSLGLVPFLLASGTGATVERPLAAVVIGGVAVSRPMAWFLIPALYAWWKKDPPPAAPVAGDGPAAGAGPAPSGGPGAGDAQGPPPVAVP